MLAHSNVAPIPKTLAPIAIDLGLPTEFAKCPPKKEAMAAGIKIVETTSPWIVDERFPKLLANCGIDVIGPMVPVSSLINCQYCHLGFNTTWGVPKNAASHGYQNCCFYISGNMEFSLQVAQSHALILRLEFDLFAMQYSAMLVDCLFLYEYGI